MKYKITTVVLTFALLLIGIAYIHTSIIFEKEYTPSRRLLSQITTEIMDLERKFNFYKTACENVEKCINSVYISALNEFLCSENLTVNHSRFREVKLSEIAVNPSDNDSLLSELVRSSCSPQYLTMQANSVIEIRFGLERAQKILYIDPEDLTPVCGFDVGPSDGMVTYEPIDFCSPEYRRVFIINQTAE